MTVRSILSLAAALSLGLASTTFAQSRKASQAPVNANQQLANNVASYIGKSGVAAGSNVSVTAQSGVVELAGEVRSQKQAEAMVQHAYTFPGVVKVTTALRLMSNVDIESAQAVEPIAPPMGYPGGGQVMPNDPIPLVSPAMPAYDMNGPRMPPYAWPTYAPYPNMSRVAYPEAYPYNAFPFIGPYYPFPKVPLGWRSVKLEWDDGHWYLGRTSTPYDYWRVKFW